MRGGSAGVLGGSESLIRNSNAVSRATVGWSLAAYLLAATSCSLVGGGPQGRSTPPSAVRSPSAPISVPPCTSEQVHARLDSGDGATAHSWHWVIVSLRGSDPCSLPTLMGAELVDATGSILATAQPHPMLPSSASPGEVVVLRPGRFLSGGVAQGPCADEQLPAGSDLRLVHERTGVIVVHVPEGRLVNVRHCEDSDPPDKPLSLWLNGFWVGRT